MSDTTKACPYCGEQILAVALKCKHCGSTLCNPADVKGPSATVSAAPARSPLHLRPSIAVLGAIVLTVCAGSWVYNWNTTGSVTGRGFTDSDIANIEQSIRSEFGNRRNITVQDVQMLRTSPRSLTGFVKVKALLLGTVTKTCTASMGDDGRSIWQCR